MQILDNQYFTYRQSPALVNGKARIRKIKGNTLVWNQLVQNGNFASTSNWSTTRVSISASSNVLTATVTEASTGKGQRVYQNLGFNDTHKRLYIVEMKGTSGKTLCFGNHTSDAAGYTVISSVTADGSWQTLSGFSNENKSYLLIGMNGDTSVGDSYQIRNVVCFDLTLMFGSGNEPTTLKQFTSLFPLSYYAYGQSLLNFNGTGIKTTGKNLWDNSQLIRGIYTDADFSYSAQNVQTSIKWYGFANTAYTVSWGIPVNLTRRIIDGVFATIQYNNIQTFTLTPTKDGYIGLSFRDSTSSTTQWNPNTTIQIEKGSTATSYEPYTTSTTSLPISTYFPTGMKSAGTVYDELSDKAITRIGSVDLGSLTWTYDSTYTRFRTEGISTLIKRPSALTEVANMICPIYESRNANETILSSFNNIIGVSTIGNVFVRNSSYSDPSTFKTAMNGVYLNYELATYTEQDVDPEDTQLMLNRALSTILGRTVSVDNPQPALDILTKGE